MSKIQNGVIVKMTLNTGATDLQDNWKHGVSRDILTETGIK